MHSGGVRATGPFDSTDPYAAALLVKAAAEGWGIGLPAVGPWTRVAAARLSGELAEWTLEYDPDLHLASFEVFYNGTCVFGSDDIVRAQGLRRGKRNDGWLISRRS